MAPPSPRSGEEKDESGEQGKFHDRFSIFLSLTSESMAIFSSSKRPTSFCMYKTKRHVVRNVQDKDEEKWKDKVNP